MKLSFEEISEKGRRCRLTEDTWFSPENEGVTLEAEAYVKLMRRGPDTILVEGELSGHLATFCDRCGGDVQNDLQCQFVYVATTKEEEVGQAEVECKDEDVYKLYLAEPLIDIDEILREQVYLELPLRTLCSKDCKGICASCGADLNKSSCVCGDDQNSSPFTILGKIRGK